MGRIGDEGPAVGKARLLEAFCRQDGRLSAVQRPQDDSFEMPHQEKIEIGGARIVAGQEEAQGLRAPVGQLEPASSITRLTCGGWPEGCSKRPSTIERGWISTSLHVRNRHEVPSTATEARGVPPESSRAAGASASGRRQPSTWKGSAADSAAR